MHDRNSTLSVYRQVGVQKQGMEVTKKGIFLLICALSVILCLVGQVFQLRGAIPDITRILKNNSLQQSTGIAAIVSPASVPKCTPVDQSQAASPADQSPDVWSYAAEMHQLHAFLTYFLGYEFEAMCASNAGTKDADIIFDVPPMVKYNSRNITIIQRRFADLIKASQRLMNKTAAPIYRYRVTLHTAPSITHPTTAILLVNETSRQGRRTGLAPSWRTKKTRHLISGGSSLRVFTSGLHTRSVCHVQDRLDGTYLATCPVYEANTRIRVQVIRQLWTQFMGSRPTRMQAGGIESINPFKELNLGFGKNHSDQTTLKKEKLNVWLKKPTGQWVWYRNGRPLENLSKKQLNKCLRNVSNLIAIGDSHTRYIMFYLYLQLGLLDSKLPAMFRDRYVRRNTAFYWSTSAEVLARTLGDLYNSVKQSGLNPATSNLKQDVLIINAFHHDIQSTRNIVTYIEGMESVFKTIGDLKRRRRDLLRIIWIGGPPVPDNIPRRNSELIADLHGWIFPRMAALGVEVLDLFPILYPVQNESPCKKHHYLCVTPKDGTVSGKVGKTLFNAMFHEICHY